MRLRYNPRRGWARLIEWMEASGKVGVWCGWFGTPIEAIKWFKP